MAELTKSISGITIRLVNPEVTSNYILVEILKSGGGNDPVILQVDGSTSIPAILDFVKGLRGVV